MSTGSKDDEPIEFWRDGEQGPRIQITTSAFSLSDSADFDRIQRELSKALTEKFPNLKVDKETRLSHQGHPAIEVMATFTVNDTYYHVIQRCLFARGRIYIITCASFEASFLSDLPAFRACLNSFEVLEEIFSPDSNETHGGPLVGAQTIALASLGLIIFGFILRRVSIARLNRTGRWPNPSAES